MKYQLLVNYILGFVVIGVTFGLLIAVLWPAKTVTPIVPPLPPPSDPVTPSQPVTPIGPVTPSQPVTPIGPVTPSQPIKPPPPPPGPTPALPVKVREYFVVGLKKPAQNTDYDPSLLNDIVKTFNAQKPPNLIIVKESQTTWKTLPNIRGEQWGTQFAWSTDEKGNHAQIRVDQSGLPGKVDVVKQKGRAGSNYVVYGFKPTQQELKASKYAIYTVLPYYVPMPNERTTQYAVWSRNDVCIQAYPTPDKIPAMPVPKNCFNNQTVAQAIANCHYNGDKCSGFSRDASGQVCYYPQLSLSARSAPITAAGKQFYSKCQNQMFPSTTPHSMSCNAKNGDADCGPGEICGNIKCSSNGACIGTCVPGTSPSPSGPFTPSQPVTPIGPVTPSQPIKVREYFVVGLKKPPKPAKQTKYDPSLLNDIIKTFNAQKPPNLIQVKDGRTTWWSLPNIKGEQWGMDFAWATDSNSKPAQIRVSQSGLPGNASIVQQDGRAWTRYVVYGFKPTQQELKASKYAIYTVLPYYVPMPNERTTQYAVWSRNDVCIQAYPTPDKIPSIPVPKNCFNNQTVSQAIANCHYNGDKCSGFSRDASGQVCYYPQLSIPARTQPMTATGKQFYSKCQNQMSM